MVKPILPFVKLKTNIGEFPFLIDTGANVSLIDPNLANSCKIGKPYDLCDRNIASASGKFITSSAIDINFFIPKIDQMCTILLHSFHSFFFGIIGTDILKRLHAVIDLETDNLILNKIIRSYIFHFFLTHLLKLH